jgi:hypothetical protein
MAVICVKEMALVNLTFDQRKWILKYYWKTETVTEKWIWNTTTDTGNGYKDTW